MPKPSPLIAPPSRPDKYGRSPGLAALSVASTSPVSTPRNATATGRPATSPKRARARKSAVSGRVPASLHSRTTSAHTASRAAASGASASRLESTRTDIALTGGSSRIATEKRSAASGGTVSSDAVPS
eukprot:366278-Chlamydomonas_euryale.AAC.43